VNEYEVQTGQDELATGADWSVVGRADSRARPRQCRIL